MKREVLKGNSEHTSIHSIDDKQKKSEQSELKNLAEKTKENISNLLVSFKQKTKKLSETIINKDKATVENTQEESLLYAMTKEVKEHNPTLADIIEKRQEKNNLKLDTKNKIMKFDVNFLYSQWSGSAPIHNNYNIVIRKEHDWKVTGWLAIPWLFNDEKYETPMGLDNFVSQLTQRIVKEEWPALSTKQEWNLKETMWDIKKIFQKIFLDPK